MTQLAKQSLMITFVAVALIFAIVGFFFADHSLAWFSENDEATAKGLSVNAKISPNLVIGKSPEQIRQENLLFSVDFEDEGRSDMIAVTHDEHVSGTFLKYLTNHYAVDNKTGNVKDGMALEFAPVPAENNEAYFIDYVVYIASAFDPLAVSSLTATIVIPETVDDKHPYFNAVSIDFYVCVGEVSEVSEVSVDTYRGTTSVSERASVELMPDGATIPLNTEGHVKVIMRCYFDGALQDPETGDAYVNSYKVKTDSVVIGVDFTAIDAEAAE